MDRLACIDLPEFPLQLLLEEHPDWARHPVAVIDRDSPQGVVLWSNPRARRTRILPGLRYAAALSLAGSLRAATVDETRIAAGIETACRVLREFSPHVEPSRELPGVFWLDASGLGYLYPRLERWGESLRTQLRRTGLHACVAVGFSRFGTYALARSDAAVTGVDTATAERKSVRAVPLQRLDFPPKVRDGLAILGATTVGGFLDLPASGVRERFGEQAYRLHKLASGDGWTPLQPEVLEEPVQWHRNLDHPFRDAPNLVFLIRQALDELLPVLAGRFQALVELELTFTLEREAHAREHSRHSERLRPAEPTLCLRTILELARLRLEAVTLARGVVEIRVRALSAAASKEQLELFLANPRRDPRAADRALARLRAEFGEKVLVRACLRDGHLPEAHFEWRPLDKIANAEPRKVHTPPLVRRIYASPQPLPRQSSNVRNDGWLLAGLEQGSVTRCLGPYVVSGGWWIRPAHREYHYVETQRGDTLWIYYDRKRRQWFLHGVVQ